MFRLSLLSALAPLGFLVMACGDGAPPEPEFPGDGINLQIVNGNYQNGIPGKELPEPLVVRAMDNQGRPLHRVVVSFIPTMGGGSAWAGAANTDPQGYAMEYWTLGPLAGENRMEARVVDPRTGDKLMLGEFIADAGWTVPPSSEVCDGEDNDQDGDTDEGLHYCINGEFAPNTDGTVCLPGYIDFNQNPVDGCEWVNIDGTYLLEPPLTMSCGDIFFENISVSSLEVTRVSATELLLQIRLQISGLLPDLTVEVTAPYDAQAKTFAYSGTTEVGDGGVSLALSIEGAFQDVGVWTGIVSASLGTCTPIDNEAVTATRL